jgi:ATP-dependent Clp protease ATP-binding subunit ClpA
MLPMVERYTLRATMAVVLAEDEASKMGAERIGPLHLLLCLLHDRHSTAMWLFRKCGVTEERAREVTKTHRGANGPVSQLTEMPLSEQSKLVLATAATESAKRGFPNVDSGHILLGVACHPDAATVALLSELGLSCDALRESLTKRLEDGSWRRQETPARGVPAT